MLFSFSQVTKPYETSDFFKYSERLRKQRIIDNYQRQLMGGSVMNRSGASTPSSDTSDSHSLHSSHSGSSSLSHSMRLAAASAAYYAATGVSGGNKAGGDMRGGYPSPHPQFHRQDSDQSLYSARSDPTDHSTYREQTPYREQTSYREPPSYREQFSSRELREQTPVGREQVAYGGGGGSGVGAGLVSSSSASDFQTVRSGNGNQPPNVRYATSQSQSAYRAQYMQAVATSSATHARYQPPTAMSCQPVTSQASFKDSGKGTGQ